MPRMPMDLEFLERGTSNANGPGILGARCLEWQWAWNFCSEWQWTWNFWSAVPRMAMDLEFLERGA